jgi:Na+-driven multidrug efflux pump
LSCILLIADPIEIVCFYYIDVVCSSSILLNASTVSGVARGGGWQHLGAYVNLGAFYLIGIPVALFFGFTMQLRGMGFWFGMIAGGATQVILLSVITATTKWDKMVRSFFSFSILKPDSCSLVMLMLLLLLNGALL